MLVLHIAPQRQCPHVQVQRCPLYHAAHMAIGVGCAPDDDLGEAPCQRNRGFYGSELRRLVAAKPGFVEQLKFRHAALDDGLITIDDVIEAALRRASPDPCLSLSRINEPGTVRTGNSGGNDAT